MITEHAVCALPDDHRHWRHLVLRVKRHDNTDQWLITWDAYYWDGMHWDPSAGAAAEYTETEALHLAEQLKVQVEMGGLTAADLLARASH